MPRRRVGEAAGPAVQMEVGYIPISNLVIGNYLKFEVLQFSVEESGRSAAWLARLPWEQEVGRSNRLAPTILFRSGESGVGSWKVIRPTDCGRAGG